VGLKDRGATMQAGSAIQALVRAGSPDTAAIERFIRAHRFPIVEGRRVTFLFHGDADSVQFRHFIFGLPALQPMRRIGDSRAWYLTVELPESSRVEYKIERILGAERELLMDPLNENVAHDPYGANSVAYGHGYITPEWTQVDPEARPGAFEEVSFASRVFGDIRHMRIYLPARFRRLRRYPLVIAHDGEDYLHFAELKVVLDNLIHRLEIPPLIVALQQSSRRLVEYGADRRHADHLALELLPALERRYPLRHDAGSRALLGASFGAVAALHAAWTHPAVFGGLLLQSGSFAFSDIGEHGRGPAFDPVAAFVNDFRAAPGQPTQRVFISCGTYESLIYENRSLVPLLQSTGMATRYVEARDGHNWDNWRDRLREGLSWLFPGPLWMVYE
jgi:enterochelin esterase family protein